MRATDHDHIVATGHCSLSLSDAEIAKDPVEKLGITEPDVLPTTFVFAPGLVLRKTLVGAQTEASILAVVDQPSS